MTNPTACLELKPCPFCGSLEGYVERYDYTSCYRQCDNCMARGPIKVIEDEDEEVPGHDPALIAWNTRATEGEAVALPVPFSIDTTHKNEGFVTLGFGDKDQRDRFIKVIQSHRNPLYTHPRATSAEVEMLRSLVAKWRDESCGGTLPMNFQQAKDADELEAALQHVYPSEVDRDAEAKHDLRNLIYASVQFDNRGETDLTWSEVSRLTDRGWMVEGDDNGSYDITDEGQAAIDAALAKRWES